MIKNYFTSYTIFRCHALLMVLFLASASPGVNADNDEAINSAIFVDKASAKGIAEIEAGHLALRESSHADVKKFARTMINEHGAINRELVRLAQRKDIAVADEAELINQAKLSLMKVREGESFDIAYARNQVTAHEEVIALFNKASRLPDSDISNFADKKLPALQEHLSMAQALLETLTPAGVELPPRKTFDIPEDSDQADESVLQPAPQEINPGENINIQ